MITRKQVQTAMQVIFPPRCVSCGEFVEEDFNLCGACWRGTPFVGGAICDACGTPLPGAPSEVLETCDDCMSNPPPWTQGRAVFLYEGRARQMVLRLKHGDRHDIVHPAARWMAAAGKDVVTERTVVCPIPLHWRRFLRRRFNQSALLASEMARHLAVPYVPDLLVRTRATLAMEGMSREERYDNLAASIVVNPKHTNRIKSQDILLVDDVMTSGATFSAATTACLEAKAAQVSVIALARVAKLP